MEIYKVQPESPITPLLLTARQAAKLLNISERTLYARTVDGSISVVRIGNRGIRYDPADLRRWIESAKNLQKGA